MKQVRRIRKTVQENRLVRARLDAVPTDVTTTNAKVALIQELIPLGLLWVEDALQEEVAQLAGARYQRDNGQPGVVRYGTQPGSIYLADQKLGIAVPRMRDLAANREVALTTYRALRQPRGADDGVLRRILAGVSCRDYATTVAVLYVAGCPNYRPTLELVRAVVAELGVEVAVEGLEVMTVEEAVRLRFLGSPSVQIDGVDIEPGVRASTAYGVACRTYGGAGVPPRRLLVAALANFPGK